MKKKKINKNTRYLLLAEGPDEIAFFKKLLNNKIRNIQIWSYDGRDNLKNELYYITNDPSFSKICKLLITRDADNNPRTTFQSTINAIKEVLGIDKNIEIRNSQIHSFTHDDKEIGILILPSSEKPGSLEDLIMSTCEESFKIAIENFLTQLKNIGLKIKKENKFKVHCFFGAKCSQKLYLKLSNAIQNCNFLNINEQLSVLQEEIIVFFTKPSGGD